MKRNLTLVIAICVFFGLEASSQSFTLGAPGNIVINNGDTITISGTTNDFDLFGHLGLTNYSGSVKSVMILKEELSLVPFCDVTFQFGIWMYPPMVYTTPQGFDVAAGATDSSFYTAYSHYGNAGTSYVKYTFFDENNPFDKAWMVFKFEIIQATALNDLSWTTPAEIFPNPTCDILNIITHNTAPVRITVMDSYGKEVAQLMDNSCSTSLDFTKFQTGMYFLLIQDTKTNLRTFYKVIKE